MQTPSTTALLSLGTALLLSVGCQQSAPDSSAESSTDKATKASFNTLGAPTVAFLVPDMRCQFSCVDAVKNTLASQPGVKEVKVDFETKQATLVVDNATFDADTAVEALIDHQFFDAKLIAAEAR